MEITPNTIALLVSLDFGFIIFTILMLFAFINSCSNYISFSDSFWFKFLTILMGAVHIVLLGSFLFLLKFYYQAKAEPQYPPNHLQRNFIINPSLRE